ncbi:MAG: XRE family transcriptional regulator [Microbacterium sp. 69-7]|mgnify:FL=1|uniref:Anaerobic benzoate catabolism transcriptional regulator n=1 Tax=Microbacterium laevaniformans TaxID=36807 RepID=A0A150HFI3_9MICO|nr:MULTISPECIES: helix-turn-helix transcriptional regulator [Microbacterium]KXZ60841.1 anaerobic benzoate catabolism transcriptional regulator [Microbacterium laevaniformans]OJU44507.1 MAG: XRE family transcriptional regulator [Microbacterium sp. 69-7]
MTNIDVPLTATTTEREDEADALTIGRRIRQLRTARGMTLDELAAAVERAPSQLSMIETGKREPKLTLLRAIAKALGATVDQLLEAEPLDERATLEIALERAMKGPTFRALGIEPFRIGKTIPDDALRALLALQGEIERLGDERSATPEEARRANVELRHLMRRQDNYFAELEEHARAILRAVDHPGGPLTQRTASDIAAHLGFSLHYVADLPASTRSVADIKHGRLYLSSTVPAKGDSRTAVLQALASRILGHAEPRSYAEFLRQRVETNYLTGALLIPEDHAVPVLLDAKSRRALSIEDLRDAYSVSYETAAHRFTNLATRHLGIPVHFLKVHESGTITKAYENDDVNFPADRLGSIEGQLCCRRWTSRAVFDIPDKFNPYYQYTDTGNGTFWCTARVETSSEGAHSVSVGVRFDDTKWFVGRETTNRGVSRHAVEVCCRRAPAELESQWRDQAWPNVRTPRTLLATLPTGAFPGVDTTDLYEFLEAHAPRG